MRIATVLLGILLFSSYFLIAQVKEDIVKKHVSAMGGEKNWQGIKTITTTCIRESEGMKIEEKKQIIPGKAIRIDYKYMSRDEAMAQENYYIIAIDNKGWKYLPETRKNTVDTLSPNEIKYYKNDYFFNDPLIGKSDASKVEYMGKETVLENEYYKFIAEYEKGKSVTIYIDCKTMLLSKCVTIDHDSESELDFDEYKKINNSVMFPQKIYNGYETITLTDVKINLPIHENVFKVVTSVPQ